MSVAVFHARDITLISVYENRTGLGCSECDTGILRSSAGLTATWLPLLLSLSLLPTVLQEKLGKDQGFVSCFMVSHMFYKV